MNKIVSSLVMLAFTAVILHTSAGTANAADVRNAWWGMSYDEVKASEPSKPTLALVSRLRYTTDMYEIKTSVEYTFEKLDRLSSVFFYLEGMSGKQKNDALERIKNDLIAEYGESVDDKQTIFQNKRTRVQVVEQEKNKITIRYLPATSHDKLPLASGNGEPDVRNVRWGMPTYDVRNKEAPRYGRDIENLITYEDTILGEKANLLYEFDQDKKLVSLSYVFKELSQPSAKALFDSLGSQLEKKYGTENNDELGALIKDMIREFKTDRTHITLTIVKDNIVLLSYEEQAFHSKKMELLQEKMDSARKKHAADLQQF